MTRISSARPMLWPLVPVYRLGLALRGFQLRSGMRPVQQLRLPVISIGNLSTGGSGKTPLTIALSRALTARGLHVDVLSRGYGRHSKSASRVDPDGSVADFGDEPLLIARDAGVPVYVAPERYQAGLLAERDTAGQVGIHLLDDGFQHRQLARDVDIILLNHGDFADHLLPAGNLREPLQAASRAHVIAIPEEEPDLEAEIRARGWRAEIWHLRRRMEIPNITGPIAAFCGIARPEQFFEGLESAGLRVASRIAFADHHPYDPHDLDCLLAAARSVRAIAFLTTEKDRVRLGSLAKSLAESLPLKSAQLHVEIENEDAAIDWLIGRLAQRS